MESAIEQSLYPLLITLNVLHETRASSRSMGFLQLTSAGDKTSSSVWQPQEHTSVPHFIKENLSSVWDNRENFRRKCALRNPNICRILGLTLY